MLALAFMIAALVLFILAAVGVAAGRFNLTAGGLACWVAALLVDKL